MKTSHNKTQWIPSLIDSLFIENRLDIPQTEMVTPKVNIIKNENGFVIDIAAPGFKKEHFSIALEKDHLIISGALENNNETEAEAEEAHNTTSFVRKEFATKNFSRSFTISKDIDTEAIQASYEAGILSVQLPVVEEKITKKMIAIS